MAKFAANTNVSVKSSMAEIEALMERFGAKTFIRHVDPETGRTAFGFEVRGHPFRVEVPKPDPKKIRKESRRYIPESRMDKKVEQERRRLWRVVVHQIKAMLVAVDEGMLTFEQAMMNYHVLPGGKTVQETFGERVEELYRGDLLPLLLPAPGRKES
jgi:hypothetical protein